MRRFSLYIGILLGFTIAFLFASIWKNDFDWGWWIGMMMGGTIGCLIIDLLTKRWSQNK
ncbi:hypothetical protein [Sediminibacillus halophilus]|uniref:PsbL protein n=1 Tax=Sediminibacillus halophilus TaxID=482461 RepID=A0A1G9NJM0_9BACI|nr:hypothetical protein [Sediminibacillus halophilus]SDL86768.1 PsbL protein [Sediminibacillus halophilus]